MSFMSTWTGFSVVWWVIAFAHGDLEHAQNLSDGVELNDTSFIPCVTEIKGFATSFLFSVETQHTIGKV